METLTLTAVCGAVSVQIITVVFYSVLETQDFVVLNTSVPTHYSLSGRYEWSDLDLSIVSANVDSRCNATVHNEFIGSDHSIVQIAIRGSDPPTKTHIPRWNFQRANWQRFSDLPLPSISDSQTFRDRVPPDVIQCWCTPLISEELIYSNVLKINIANKRIRNISITHDRIITQKRIHKAFRIWQERRSCTTWKALAYHSLRTTGLYPRSWNSRISCVKQAFYKQPRHPFPKQNIRKNSVPWWNAECDRAIKNKNHAFNRMKRTIPQTDIII